MKKLLMFLAIFQIIFAFCQENEIIPITIFKGGVEIEKSFDIYLVNTDTIIPLNKYEIKKKHLNDYSLRICFNKDRLLIPLRNDLVNHVKIFLDRKSYKKVLNEANFGIGNPFKKYYYVDLGLDIMLKVSRSKKKYCEINPT
jgi:hypothetical protein